MRILRSQEALIQCSRIVQTLALPLTYSHYNQFKRPAKNGARQRSWLRSMRQGNFSVLQYVWPLSSQLSRNIRGRKAWVEHLIQLSSSGTTNFKQEMVIWFLAEFSWKKNQRIMLYRSQSFCGLYDTWWLKEIKSSNGSWLETARKAQFKSGNFGG